LEVENEVGLIFLFLFFLFERDFIDGEIEGLLMAFLGDRHTL
jgi:hypothetical protein